MSYQPVRALCVVGTRPNLVKMAPLYEALQLLPAWELQLLHTGQHFDQQMNQVFFTQLGLPEPHFHLGVQGGSHTEQTAQMLLALEPILRNTQPDLVVVVGDVTSTLAAALAAAQLHIPVAHVEAGLRSGNNHMPEELNRRLTDAVSAHLFATEQAAVDNLLREGVPATRIHLVGNVMIDALLTHLQEAENLRLTEQAGLYPGAYALLTLHRPSNVDTPDMLRRALEIIRRAAERLPLVFPVHPRTRMRLQTLGLFAELESIPNVHLLPPQGYLEFLHWMMNARVVLTDSGGIQEETTFLQIPCLTLRDETERPCTIELGTNTLLPGLNPDLVARTLDLTLRAKTFPKRIPPLWDGGAANRIAAILQNLVHKNPSCTFFP